MMGTLLSALLALGREIAGRKPCGELTEAGMVALGEVKP